MGRAPCCESKLEGPLQLKKGAWTAEEDEKLVSFIRKNNGHGSWRTLPRLAGLQRCGKSCRLRWTNYLRPNIKRGNFTSDEEWTITHLHALLGNKWSSIASHLPGRTDNEVKNHWNTHLKKRLSRIGIDPVTHRPMSLSHGINLNSKSQEVKDDISMMKHSKLYSSITCCNHQSAQKTALPKLSVLDRSYVSHMAQWELARLEAEGRQMQGKASVPSASGSSSSSSDCTKGAASAGGQVDTENDQLMEMILEEMLEAAPLPRLDRANSSSCSAGSHFFNEADITSDLTSLICNVMSPQLSPAAPSDPNSLRAPLLPASPPCEPTTTAFWANMLSLVAPSFPHGQLVDASVVLSS